MTFIRPQTTDHGPWTTVNRPQTVDDKRSVMCRSMVHSLCFFKSSRNFKRWGLWSVVCGPWSFPYLAPQFFQMAEVKKQNPAAKSQNLFSKENYKWMLIGLVVILLGVLLMIGGKSNDPNQFNVNEVYSFRRITLAPIVILAGLVIEIYAIFRKPTKR